MSDIKTPDIKKQLSFWRWFFKGHEASPGYKSLFNKWVFVHLVFGALLCLTVPSCLQQAAISALLPLSGILIGLTFAWAGNANALLQSQDIKKLSEYSKGGFIEYVFIYQKSILVIIVAIVIWAFAGLGLLDWPDNYNTSNLIIRTVVYSFTSFTLQVCWRTILFVQHTVLMSKMVHELPDNQSSGQDKND